MPVSGVLSNGGVFDIRQLGKRSPRTADEQSKRDGEFAPENELPPEQSGAPEAEPDPPSSQASSSDDGYIDYGLPDDLADLLRTAAKPP
jgi:hypothetical protein